MAKKILVVVDAQNDFITGVLGNKECDVATNVIAEEIRSGKYDDVIFTRDTHDENYLNTQEGKKLPVAHCIKGSKGWKIIPELQELTKDCMMVEKPSFGSTQLAHIAARGRYEKIELVGLCTDICVISNAMILKSSLPEAEISVDANCCAGVSPESHRNALEAMKMCQIEILI